MCSVTFGGRLKRIRKERGFTQSELAELIGISTQAVSKWENDMGMPDIAQIVPLARVLNVSTDTLLGFCSDSDNAIILQAINEARAEKGTYSGYLKLKELKKRYPDNVMLLLELLEFAVAAVFCENRCDDAAAFEVYSEAERTFKMITTYSSNASDILRARMIMVFFHSTNGNFAKAEEQLPHFPCRADMTQNNMLAQIAHFRGDYKTEIAARNRDLLYLYEGMLDCAATLGGAYMRNREYAKAAETFKTALSIIEQTFKEEEYIPPLHRRDEGDMYFMLAEACLALNDAENAFSEIEKMWDSHKISSQIFDGSYRPKTPLFGGIPAWWYRRRKTVKKEAESILALLKREEFDVLHSDIRYITLTEEIENELTNATNENL